MAVSDCRITAGPAILAAGINACWPLWLVCVGGVILVIIAILALLLLTGHTDFPTTRRINRPFSNPISGASGQEGAVDSPIEIQFIRMGIYSNVKSMVLTKKQWITVGKNADFCLDDQDKQLSDVHFRICLTGDTLLVAAVEETFVNGVPIRQLGAVPMQSGEQLRAGGYEYRVVFLSWKGRESVT